MPTPSLFDFEESEKQAVANEENEPKLAMPQPGIRSDARVAYLQFAMADCKYICDRSNAAASHARRCHLLINQEDARHECLLERS
jgi:hypothetical protein